MVDLSIVMLVYQRVSRLIICCTIFLRFTALTLWRIPKNDHVLATQMQIHDVRRLKLRFPQLDLLELLPGTGKSSKEV
jgi:hypothetical protein